MTAAQKSQIRVGVITTILGATILAVAGWGSQAVIFRPEFEARTTGMESAMYHHDQKLENKLDRVLDVVCADRTPKPRACE